MCKVAVEGAKTDANVLARNGDLGSSLRVVVSQGIHNDVGVILGNVLGHLVDKAQQAAGSALPLSGKVLVSVRERERAELLPIVKTLAESGFELVATEGTGKFLDANGIKHSLVHKLNEGRPNVADLIRNREVALIINTPMGKLSKIDDSYIRMLAIQYKIPYMTTIAAAKAYSLGDFEKKKITRMVPFG